MPRGTHRYKGHPLRNTNVGYEDPINSPGPPTSPLVLSSCWTMNCEAGSSHGVRQGLVLRANQTWVFHRNRCRHLLLGHGAQRKAFPLPAASHQPQASPSRNFRHPSCLCSSWLHSTRLTRPVEQRRGRTILLQALYPPPHPKDCPLPRTN